MLLKDKSKRGQVAALILRKLKGSDSYDRLKSYNEGQMSSVPMSEDKTAELDQSSALDTAAEKMLQAFQSSDAASLKSALMQFISMAKSEEHSESEDD